MTDNEQEPGDRWQQLIGAFDPERNMRALAEMMQAAASGSEELLDSVRSDQSPGDGSTSPIREAMVQAERSFAQLYEAVGQFMVERPMRPGGSSDSSAMTAEVVVIDGVGTTSIPGTAGQSTPLCSDLLRNDGTRLPSQSIRVMESESFEQGDVSYVIRVDVPADAAAGLYHGQLLVPGEEGVVIPLSVRVIIDDAAP